MTTIAPIPPAAPAVSRLGQATAIEQSRAVAQVHAAVLVAMQYPRNQAAAIAAMRESCSYEGLADKAFYKYPRGGKSVTGPSIHLARELARIWGNIDYNVAELLRDDERGQSEMQATAWDLQTNTRVSSVFVVAHKRDKTEGGGELTQQRDIYENNANQGARRVREAIFSVLPPWFTSEAEAICRQTIENGGGVPLPKRIADTVRDFETIGVTVDRLEQQIGRSSDAWTATDVAQLRITGGSIHRGEITADEAFPPERITVAEIKTAKPKASAPASTTAAPKPAPVTEPAPAPAEQATPAAEPTQPTTAATEETADAPATVSRSDGDKQATRKQLDAIAELLPKLGVESRADRLHVLGKLIGQDLVSLTNLTRAEADTVTELLGRLAQDEQPSRALDVVLVNIAEADNAGGA
ncbi:MAG: hypothetical protein ABIQ18_38310 [Umezawaea sp.]